MKTIRIENDLFKYNVDIIHCKSDKEFQKYIDMHNRIHSEKQLESIWQDYDWFFHEVEWVWCIVLKNISISIISHEVVHLVYNLFSRNGIPCARENQETFAYCLGWYVSEILKWLNITKVTWYDLKKTTIKKS